jgi:SAM-dependent methyltransferase
MSEAAHDPCFTWNNSLASGLFMAPVCPVCAGQTQWFDVVDFNKNCAEGRGGALPLSGHPVYYTRCTACSFCFAPALHQWSSEEMAARIYNEGYAQVDPDYIEARPRNSADNLLQLFPSLGEARIKHLDYGSGSGRLSEMLCGAGWQSQPYDPFVPGTAAPEPNEQFGLITAFEVFEHVADLNGLTQFIRDHLEPGGLLVFSTLLNDSDIVPGQRLSWWYASPRNGHISLFSKQSLLITLQRCGLAGYASASAVLHIAGTRWPVWSQHLLQKNDPS